MNLRALAKWIKEEEAIKKFWNSWAVGASLWLIFSCITIDWFYREPWPGYAIGVLAVVAGIMSVREIKTLGRILWVFLLVCLLITEFRAIDKDHADNAAEMQKQRGEQDKKFAEVLAAQNGDFLATAKGLEQSYSQSQDQFGATMSGITSEIDTITGGKSYVFLSYAPGQNFLFFIHHGDYPLSSTTARIVDIDDMARHMSGTTLEVQEITKGHVREVPIPAELYSGISQFDNRMKDQLNWNIFFTARNGDWTEELRLRRGGNGWVKAIRVAGSSFSASMKGKVMCQTIDKGFPLETLRKDDIIGHRPVSPKLPPCQ